MFRLSVLVLGFFSLLIGLPSSLALAQSEQSAVIPGTDGGEIARVSIDEIVDPFETYDPNNPPIRGYHYVLVTLTVDNTGSRPIQIDPGRLMLRDSDGFLYGDQTIYREEDAAGPDLDYQELAAGATVSGAVGFQVLNGVELAELLVTPDSEQLVQLMEFDGIDSAPLGTEVALIGSEGETIGTVVATALADPYEDYPGDAAPGRGRHYVMLDVTISNASVRPMQIDPNAILLQDTEGFLYGSAYVPRPDGATPELEYQELAAGEEMSGTVGFEVISGVQLWRVLYQPANDRLLVLSDLTADAEREPEPDAEATTSPVDVDGADLGEVDCGVIEEWLTDASADASVVFSVTGTVMFMKIEEDPEFVAIARQVTDAFMFSAAALEEADVPAEVAELNQSLADAYVAYGTALEAVADATESGDQDAIDEAGQALYDAEPALIEATQAVAELAATCGIETDG